jgi:protein-S-isoprenylcysteine O-methyltransferase Ste14
MTLAHFTLIAVLLCWLAFTLIFRLRKRPPKAEVRQRDPRAIWGIVIQAVGFVVVWAGPPRSLNPNFAVSPTEEIVLAVITIALAVISVVMVNWAVRTLGKQWAYTARIVEGHKLITEGPYRIVRHPIYSGMFGLLVASGLALGDWLRLILAIVIFLVGTFIRTHAEESLLRETFGVEYDDYARRVKALIPGIF